MKSFKKGQKVWSVRGGWDTVEKVTTGEYSIELSSGMVFTGEGKFSKLDSRPTLFHDEPKDWPDPEPVCTFLVDQPLLVRCGAPLEWKLAYFSELRNGVMYCWWGGLKSQHTTKTQYCAEYQTLDEVLGE